MESVRPLLFPSWSAVLGLGFRKPVQGCSPEVGAQVCVCVSPALRWHHRAPGPFARALLTSNVVSVRSRRVTEQSNMRDSFRFYKYAVTAVLWLVCLFCFCFCFYQDPVYQGLIFFFHLCIQIQCKRTLLSVLLSAKLHFTFTFTSTSIFI